MSIRRLDVCFSALKAHGRKALIPYVSAGDPDPEQTVDVLHALVAGGADVLELGVPFSDPAADGETIQLAHERALAKGVRFSDVVAMIRRFRQDDDRTPLVVMGYLNSFERRGFAQAVADLSAAGADGVILVDCPIEALPDYEAVLQQEGVMPILLVAPTTSATRLDKIIEQAQGFLYYVSLRGVTGKQKADAGNIAAAVAQLRQKTDVPVCIGFGIRDGVTAKAMAEIADGVVIGSALVEALHHASASGQSLCETASHFVADIRSAIDGE